MLNNQKKMELITCSILIDTNQIGNCNAKYVLLQKHQNGEEVLMANERYVMLVVCNMPNTEEWNRKLTGILILNFNNVTKFSILCILVITNVHMSIILLIYRRLF